MGEEGRGWGSVGGMLGKKERETRRGRELGREGEGYLLISHGHL